MAHVCADLVGDTTTTIGTGSLTLANVSPAVGRTFGAVCANNDTFLYVIRHRTANEWETGLGTYNTTGPAFTRSVISSSNADALVNFSAGTKDVEMVTPASASQWGTITPTDSTPQNDYNPAGLAGAGTLRWTGTATTKFTGLAGGYEGREITIQNGTTDYLLWLEHENTVSAAANRFKLPQLFPAFLMPGDSLTLKYNGSASRWDVVQWPNKGMAMGLSVLDDFMSFSPNATLTNSGGLFGSVGSGSAGGVLGVTTGVNTTERVAGAVSLVTGTTATGKGALGAAVSASIVPTLGCGLCVGRVQIPTAVTGTETFSCLIGFHEAGATITDGVTWEYRWTGSVAEWSQTRWAAAAATRTNTGSPTPDANYLWCVVFVNPGWTRADFIYSTDSVSFTIASSPTTGFPSNAQYAGVGASITKSVGTTSRVANLDLLGYRFDSLRA